MDPEGKKHLDDKKKEREEEHSHTAFFDKQCSLFIARVLIDMGRK
jgi:hypothetical protein